MTLLQILNIIKRHWWIILLTLAITVLGALAVTRFVPVRYSAVAMLRVQTAVEGAVGQYSSYNIFYADRLMRTYSHIAVSTPVIEEVAARLGLSSIPNADVRVIADTELMEITVADTDPYAAASIVNMLAQILVERSQDLYGSGVSESQILQEQLTQLETEIAAAQSQYAALLTTPEPNIEQITEAERALAVKQGIYTNLLTQLQNAEAEDALRLNAVSIVEQASVPTRPSQPNVPVIVMLTSAFGLITGLGLALTAENLDSRLRSNLDIERMTGLPVLGQIPHLRLGRFKVRKLSTEHQAAFRRLWINLSVVLSKRDQLTLIKGIGAIYSARLHKAGITTCRQIAEMRPEDLGRAAGMPEWSLNRTTQWIEQAQALVASENKTSAAHNGPFVLLVTSARSGEGKSAIAASLGASAARCDLRALLIDADLWRPTLHQMVEVPNDTGLIDILSHQNTVEDAIQHTSIPQLDILASGGALRSGESFPGFDNLQAQVLDPLTNYDLIVIDSPAQLEIADAPMLARVAEAVLAVVSYERTQNADLKSLMRQLLHVNAHTVGVVLNRVPRRYSLYHYTTTPADSLPGRAMVTES